jgi:hypothetical protein
MFLSREMGLSGFWDEVYGVVEKVANVAQAVVPSSGMSIVQPVGSGPFALGVGLPGWLLPAGLGLAAFLLLRGRR